MRDSTETLSTPRLALRRFSAEDIDLLDRLNSDPAVTRYAGGVKTREQTQAMLQTRILEYYALNPGLGIWATIERASGVCVGLHLLNHIQGESFIQVGYLLYPQFWGRGYATEMAATILRYGFSTLGLAQICAITNLENVDSQRVLLKTGLLRKGERSFAHPSYASEGPLAWFERDAQTWLAERI